MAAAHLAGCHFAIWSNVIFGVLAERLPSLYDGAGEMSSERNLWAVSLACFTPISVPIRIYIRRRALAE